jgi:hypothetical protein
MLTKKKLILDITMFGAFLTVSNPRFTGISIHEWLGMSFIAAIITHLLFNWEWIINVGKTFFKKLWHQSRLNFAVDTAFFIVMTGVLFSGLMISKSVLPTLGIQLDVSRSWRSIHFMLSDASVILLGLHFALHWKWVVTNVGRYIVNPVRGVFQRSNVPQVFTAQPVKVEESKS